MYGELYQYLILNKQLTIPGIGTFMLERIPAEPDFASKLIYPPSYTISLYHGNNSPSMKLFGWLASVLRTTEREAVIRFNDFAFEVRNKVMNGNKLDWDGIGSLSKGLAGEIRFEPELKDQPRGAPISAVKVLREKAEHTVRVGEDEKTSVEMIELLAPATERKSYWWVAALVILACSLLFIIIYLSGKGLNTSSVGNQQGASSTRPSSGAVATP